MKNSLYVMTRSIVATLAVATMLVASEEEERIEHKRLYTEPDAAASGGITGSVASPAGPIRQILAIPAAHPEKVYRGEFTGGDRRYFSFTGLPMDRYDLVVIFEDAAYEGLRLTRAENSLTAQDVQQIRETLDRSEPFFTVKIIHRVEGETGRGNQARVFCTMARDQEAEMYAGPIIRKGMRRTHKLIIFQQVGPGWQIVRARDLYPVWIENNEKHRLRPSHHHKPSLSGIRVTDQIRDIGALSL